MENTSVVHDTGQDRRRHNVANPPLVLRCCWTALRPARLWWSLARSGARPAWTCSNHSREGKRQTGRATQLWEEADRAEGWRDCRRACSVRPAPKKNSRYRRKLLEKARKVHNLTLDVKWLSWRMWMQNIVCTMQGIIQQIRFLSQKENNAVVIRIRFHTFFNRRKLIVRY